MGSCRRFFSTAWRLPAFLCLVVGLASGECRGQTRAVVDVDALQRAGFVPFVVSDGSRELPAVVYVPPAYTPDRKWPLMVFLHGGKGRGSDGWSHVEDGIGEQILAHPERFEGLVFMPQCPDGFAWASVPDQPMPEAGSFITDGIDRIVREYSIDEDRISLTGYSMGGFGTFLYGAGRIERFSALMPICGGGRVEDAPRLATRPLRVFHGADDPVISPERSRTMVAAIKAAGGDVVYTEYLGTDHNAWDQTYQNAENIAWLFSQRRSHR